MTKLTSRACSGTSAIVWPPGAATLESGNVGAATTYPWLARCVVRKVDCVL